MESKTYRSYVVFILLLGAWLALTCFVDFLAVPAVFRESSSRIDAGNIGIVVFSSINKIELVFSVLMLLCAFLFRSAVQWRKTFFATLIALLALIVVYNVHMTPQVEKQTLLMRDFEEGSPEYQKAEETHYFYHSLYRKTDSAKILTLLSLVVFSLRRQKLLDNEDTQKV